MTATLMAIEMFSELYGFRQPQMIANLMPMEMLNEPYAYGLAPNDRLFDANENAQRALRFRTGPK